ncbi:DUF4261 domain-containing protein [Saccharibacillus sp. CPCC 101409]|uniref:DUF4261 domain-containing protein n=1 Tax=Saccharibacillus sp. CPCC 101409 TaxID=3058041 RepID=UPI002672C8B8|nr:DUF4261 domain-containing protein [Saccharibacillus sp. CPCC 101409]MDO3409420.1 DUF4261 domain-containing protein [Saccharibacillus sp. CPCC 101409]
MSFFTKLLNKIKAETQSRQPEREEEHERAEAYDDSRGPARRTSEFERVARGSADWTRIPDERPGTQTLNRSILLAQPEHDFGGFMLALREQGLSESTEGGLHEGGIVLHHRGMTAVCAYNPSPIPDGEVEQNCKYNSLWPDAQAAVEGYAAQIEVSLRNVSDGLAGHKFLTGIVAALLTDTPNALAVYSAPMVVSRAAYLASTEMLEEGLLPINLWVFVGLYDTPSGCCAYTHGMRDFGSDELELLNTQRPSGEAFEMMFSVAAYAIERNLVFQGGEEIAFKDEQSLTLTRSAGTALEGTTLKVEGF